MAISKKITTVDLTGLSWSSSSIDLSTIIIKFCLVLFARNEFLLTLKL